MKTRYWGLIVGLVLFLLFSLLAQTSTIHQPTSLFDYLGNATFFFNFTSLLVPAIISSIFFPKGGTPDVIIILLFSLFQFLFGGFFIGKLFESKKSIKGRNRS